MDADREMKATVALGFVLGSLEFQEELAEPLSPAQVSRLAREIRERMGWPDRAAEAARRDWPSAMRDAG